MNSDGLLIIRMNTPQDRFTIMYNRLIAGIVRCTDLADRMTVPNCVFPIASSPGPVRSSLRAALSSELPGGMNLNGTLL